MIGKYVDVTNFNRQQALKFMATKCTECDIYGRCSREDVKICRDKTDYLIEKIRREEEQRKTKYLASTNVSRNGAYIQYVYKEE